MDKLKELSDKLKGKIKVQRQFDVNFKHPSSRHLSVRNYRGYGIKVDDHLDIFTVGVKVNSELAFSINSPNILFSYKLPVQLDSSPCILYVRDETNSILNNDSDLKSFLNSLFLFLKKLHLSKTESGFFYRNYILFAFDVQRDLITVINDIIDFINENQRLFAQDSQKLKSSSTFPGNLKPLLPYTKKYAISDDVEREQLIEAMSKSEKSALIRVVKPLFNDINIFLNSFKDEPLSEEAVAIGELAELVGELLLADE
jgi:hypothetical protein